VFKEKSQKNFLDFCKNKAAKTIGTASACGQSNKLIT
jgi:hypothetical protein